MIAFGNLFAGVQPAGSEAFTELLAAPGVRVERIVSSGQATPASAWLEQDQAEWVVLLSGGAALLFEGETEVRTLVPGDWLLIPRNTRHRVEWTLATGPSVWLAVHVDTSAP